MIFFIHERLSYSYKEREKSKFLNCPCLIF